MNRSTAALGFRRSQRYRVPADARRQAIAETSAFLTWALRTDQQLPRIPRRRVDRGGFSQMLRHPLGGRLITYWWAQALERIREH